MIYSTFLSKYLCLYVTITISVLALFLKYKGKICPYFLRCGHFILVIRIAKDNYSLIIFYVINETRP